MSAEIFLPSQDNIAPKFHIDRVGFGTSMVQYIILGLPVGVRPNQSQCGCSPPGWLWIKAAWYAGWVRNVVN